MAPKQKQAEDQAPASTREVTETSSVDSPVTRVWEIALDMLAELPAGTELSRREVVDACVAEGIALNTARTQYQRFYTALTR